MAIPILPLAFDATVASFSATATPFQSLDRLLASRTTKIGRWKLCKIQKNQFERIFITQPQLILKNGKFIQNKILCPVEIIFVVQIESLF